MLKPPERLCVYPPHFIGDSILHIPLLRQLRLNFPSSELTYVVPKAAQALVKACPYVDAVLTPPNGLQQQVNWFKAQQFSALLLTRPSWSTALAASLAGIPHRLGFRYQRLGPSRYAKTRFWLTHTLPYPALDTQTHQVDTLNQFLEFWGKAPVVGGNSLELWPEDGALQRLRQKFHQTDQPLGVLHLTAASANKAVPLERWNWTVQKLLEKNYQLVVTGTEADRDTYEQWLQDKPWPVVNLAGLISLTELLALLEQADLLVGLDSAPLHMATAVGTPKIAGLYGATNEAQWAPLAPPSSRVKLMHFELPCRPCMTKTCDTNQCREDWTGSALWGQVSTLLN